MNNETEELKRITDMIDALKIEYGLSAEECFAIRLNFVHAFGVLSWIIEKKTKK